MKIVFESKNYKIITPDNELEAVKMSRNTSWCTSEIKTALKYLSKGSLFFIQEKETNKNIVLFFIPKNRNSGRFEIAPSNYHHQEKSANMQKIQQMKDEKIFEFIKNISETAKTKFNNYNNEIILLIKKYCAGNCFNFRTALALVELDERRKNDISILSAICILNKKRDKDFEKRLSEMKFSTKAALTAYCYFRRLVKDRMPEFERIILQSPGYRKYYIQYLNSTGKYKPKVAKEILAKIKEIELKKQKKTKIKKVIKRKSQSKQ